MTSEGQNGSKKQKLLELLGKGYERSQLINDLGYAERTVDEAIKEYRELHGDLPSKSAPVAKETRHELMKMGQKDMVAPESIVETLVLPQDGKTATVWKDGYLSCLYQVFGVARLLQVLSAGQAEVVTSQLQLWQQAKESSRDIALEAAHQTALEIANAIDAKVAQVSKPEPSERTIADRMLGPVADMMGQQMSRMFGGMLPGSGQGQMPGAPPSLPSERWKYQDKRSKSQTEGEKGND
jgi:hypothetical protein